MIDLAKIHGLAYIIVGLFVGIASWRINYEKLYIFYYASLFLIAFGVAKLLINFIQGKSKEKTENKKEAVKQQYARLRQNQQGQYKYCPRCRNVMGVYDNFCSKCGARV